MTKPAPDILAVLKMALKIIEREFPNGQAVIDLRAAIAEVETNEAWERQKLAWRGSAERRRAD